MTGTPSTSPATPARALEDLAAAVLVGLERAGRKEPPAALLTRAAAAATRARAGLEPPSAHGPDVAEPDSHPSCSRNAAAILEQIVRENWLELVQEWTALAAARSRRAVDAILPVLLELCRARKELAPHVAPVLGRRGEWLAGLNPDWTTGAGLPVDLESAWQTGTSPERRALLLRIRKSDPARARALVQSTWTTDSAEDRARFLEALLIGLSMEDEPFLESALPDRRKSVRQPVAELLRRLPESRLIARMAAAARPLLRLEVARKKRRIILVLPKDFDAAWERDGIEEKAPQGTGQKAWWATQIISCVPTARSSEWLDLQPADLLAAAEEGDHAKALIEAWAAAAARLADPAWCEAILRHRLDHKDRRAAEGSELLVALPPREREAVAGQIVEHEKTGLAERLQILATLDHAWSPAFSAKACRALTATARKRATRYEVYDAIEPVARRIHPSCSSEFETILETLVEGPGAPSVQTCASILRLRAEMHKEFS